MSHAIIDAIYGDIRVKKQKAWTYNHGHKIMKHLKILVKVPFATSKVVLDIYHKKHCIGVASRVAEQL